jgi:hypothetical protein
MNRATGPRNSRMDPVTVAVVSALAAGAAAGATKIATSAIRDTYAVLKRLINDRYQRVAPFADAVEADPGSEPEKMVLAKQLDQAGAAHDGALKVAAQALLDAIDELRTKPEAAALFDFEILHRARNVQLEHIEDSGTIFRAGEATFGGDFKAKGIRQRPIGVTAKKLMQATSGGPAPSSR